MKVTQEGHGISLVSPTVNLLPHGRKIGAVCSLGKMNLSACDLAAK